MLFFFFFFFKQKTAYEMSVSDWSSGVCSSDLQADGRRYAFTQCEAADARRVLPCFDEPSFKARFRVAVTLASDHTAVSNSPVESEEPAGRGGSRTIRFARTPPLSTYLLALAV